MAGKQPKWIVGTALAAGMVMTAGPPTWAATQTFTNEATFQAAAGPLSLEDFEGETPQDDQPSFDVDGFVVAASNLDIQADNDLFGDQLLNAGSGEGNTAVTFTFDNPITAFGLWSHDPADQSNDVTFSIGAASGIAFPDGASDRTLFFGFISDTPFTVATLTSVPDDSVDYDNVQFSSRTTVVPTPAAFAAGLALLGGLMLRRRSHA